MPIELFSYEALFIGSTLSLQLLSAMHALLRKREPRSALGWIAVCIGLPILGAFLYFVFGVNRVQTRALKLKHKTEQQRQRNDEGDEERYVWGREPWRNRYTDGNQVQPLFGSHQAYPQMLESIASARESVFLSSYIFRGDATGQRFIAALIAAAQRKVRVHVLIDGVGQYYSWRRVTAPLRQGGVDVCHYLPPRLLPPSLHINLRNHRKILVVDEEVAFTGGMNIGEDNYAIDEDPNGATDLQFRLRGPIVAQIASVFCHDWDYASGVTLATSGRASEAPAGDATCRVVIDGPDENLDSLALRILSAVSAARQSVTVVTPYFLPTRELIGALKAAGVRNVRVRILLPARSNLRFVDWATRNMLWELLQIGIEVYFIPPPFRHSKLLIIDDAYVLLGSANWDARSLRLNFELAVEVRCQVLARSLSKHCDHAESISTRTSLSAMDGRSIPAKIRDAVFWLASPYL